MADIICQLFFHSSQKRHHFPMSSSFWAIHHLLPYQLDCERDIDNKFDSFVYGYEYMLVYSV